MLGVRPPPIKPARFAPTNQIPKIFWTIHSHPNDAFTTIPNEKSRTSIVGFKEFDDALFIGRMIDTYYTSQREFPDVTAVGRLVLPAPKTGDVLNHIYIQKWDFDDLKLECTRNILDLLSVNGLNTTNRGFAFYGVQYKFEANDPEFYRARFEQLLPLNNDPDDGPY